MVQEMMKKGKKSFGVGKTRNWWNTDVKRPQQRHHATRRALRGIGVQKINICNESSDGR